MSPAPRRAAWTAASAAAWRPAPRPNLAQLLTTVLVARSSWAGVGAGTPAAVRAAVITVSCAGDATAGAAGLAPGAVGMVAEPAGRLPVTYVVAPEGAIVRALAGPSIMPNWAMEVPKAGPSLGRRQMSRFGAIIMNKEIRNPKKFLNNQFDFLYLLFILHSGLMFCLLFFILNLCK